MSSGPCACAARTTRRRRVARGKIRIEEFDSLTEAPVAALLKFGASGLPGAAATASSPAPQRHGGATVPLSIGVDLLTRPSTSSRGIIIRARAR